jgi:hypothetical protein
LIPFLPGPADGDIKISASVMSLKDRPRYSCLKAKRRALGIGKRGELDDLLLLGYTVDHKGTQGERFYGFTISGFLIGIRRDDLVSRYNDIFTAILFYQFAPVFFIKFPFGFKHNRLLNINLPQFGDTVRGYIWVRLV